MNTKNAATQAKTSEYYSIRILWAGMAAGLACMAALVIAGLVQGSAGMVVMASSVAAALVAGTTAASASIKKKAAARA